MKKQRQVSLSFQVFSLVPTCIILCSYVDQTPKVYARLKKRKRNLSVQLQINLFLVLLCYSSI